MALRIDSSQNRNLYVGTGTEVAVNDGNAIITGNVGIGTTTPGAPLTLNGNGQSNNYSGVLRIFNTYATGPWSHIALPDSLSSTSSSNNFYLIGRGNNYTDRVMSFHIPTDGDYGSGAQPKFGFYNTGAVLLHSIEAETGTSYFKGNVGIGTTSPNADLSIGKNGNATGGNIQLGVDTNNTNKYCSITTKAYASNTQTKGFVNVASQAYADNNHTFIGGGIAELDASNQIRFYTASGVNITSGTERMRIDSAGAIKFNAYGSGAFPGTEAYRLGVDSSGNVIEITDGGGTVTGSGAATQVAFWDTNTSLSGNSNLYWDSTNNHLGIGDTTPGSRLKVSSGTSETSIYTVDIYHTRNNPDVGTHAMRLNMDLSGADNTTADRLNSGLLVDIDSSANGDGSNEHRIYGVNTAVHFTGFSDIVRGGSFLAESNYTSGKTAQLVGVYGNAVHDANDTAGGVSNMYGVYGNSAIQDKGDIDNAFGAFGYVTIQNSRTEDVDVTKGVEGEVEINAETALNYGNMIAISGIIDNNEGSTPNFGNQYLFKGDYQGTKGANAYGIWTEGDKNYFSGNVGIGTSTPSALLHVKGGDGVTGVIKVEGGNNNVAAEGEINSQIDFGSNDASVWSSGNIGGRIASVTEATNGALVGMAFSTFKQGTASPDLLSEKVRIRNNGDVGIGTPSPGAKLDVNGAANIKGTANFAPVLTLGTAGAINAVINSADEMFFNIDSDNNQTNAAFWFGHNSTQGNTASNLMIIKDNGRVGIGITNPAVPLDVEGKIRSNDSNSGDYLEIFCDGSVSGYNYITTSANDLLVAPQSGGLLVQGENYGSGFDGRIQVYNALNAAVKVKLHSNGDSYLNGGNVGINQSAPLTRLDIIGSLGSGSTAQQSNIKTATPSAGSTAVFRNGGNSSITIQGDNQVSSNTFASLNFGIWSDMTDGQIIYSFQDQFMSFSTANSEKLRIESGGEVGINTISPSATLHLKAIASNGVPFKLEGHPSTTVEQMLIITSKAFNSSDAWYNLVTQAGDGAGGATNTCIIERDGDLRNKNNSYGQISDSRLKENITDATPKLDDVMKVKVKNFNFIGEDLKQIGVVAQELEEVFPGLVKEDKQPDVNGKEGGIYKSVKYSVLVPILLKAMQEQQDQIEDLKTRITQLEN